MPHHIYIWVFCGSSHIWSNYIKAYCDTQVMQCVFEVSCLNQRNYLKTVMKRCKCMHKQHFAMYIKITLHYEKCMCEWKVATRMFYFRKTSKYSTKFHLMIRPLHIKAWGICFFEKVILKIWEESECEIFLLIFSSN